MKKMLPLLLIFVFPLMAGCGGQKYETPMSESFEKMERVANDIEEIKKEAIEKYGTGVVLGTGDVETGAVATGSVETGTIITGEVITGDVVSTGIDLPTESVLIETGETSLYFPKQPKYIKGNKYGDNTEQLNTFAKKNMQETYVANDASVIVFYTEKDIPEGKSIVAYIDIVGGKRHCGGNITMPYDKHINVFSLTGMDLRGTNCDGDWTKKINGKNVRVGGYVNTYDGNYIKSIEFH